MSKGKWNKYEIKAERITKIKIGRLYLQTAEFCGNESLPREFAYRGKFFLFWIQARHKETELKTGNKRRKWGVD